jgi:hypothetical protein
MDDVLEWEKETDSAGGAEELTNLKTAENSGRAQV